MPDKGHMETEALLRALEKRIAAEYRKANREITRKVNAYMSEFKRKDKEWREKLENGDITEAEYKAWQTGQVMIGKRWEEMRHTLAQDYANTNDLAKQMAFDSMPDVYALNHNYATFEVEKGGKVDTSYTLYDRPTVERLIRDDPKLLPDPRPGSPLAQKLAKHKELRWEEQHVQSVVLQSILQGESLEQTAKRFSQLTEMNYRQSVRYARTATTGAQNAGRVDGYKRAEKLGVNMKQTWLATLDSRTRHEHRLLDGQEVDVGEPFIMDGFKLKYPGDPAAPAHLLFNCRCTVIAKVKGVDFNVSDKTQRDDKIGDMSYEEWKGEHKTAPKPPENVPEGKAVEVKADKPAKGEYKEEKIQPSKSYVELTERLNKAKIEEITVKPLEKPLTEQQIIAKLGGGDMTEGSCASLSFAYAANKGGVDVIDFRGGESQKFFSQNVNLNEICKLNGVVSNTAKDTNDFKAINSLLKETEYNKEYILLTGKHAAVIRRIEGKGFEYLEMQTDDDNGFKKLTTDLLKNRFGCKKSHSIYGNKLEASTSIIDRETLSNSNEFKELMKYINTPANAQKKGASGYAK